MIRYRLADLVSSRNKGSVAALPQLAGTLASEQEYLKAVRSLLRELAREAREGVIPLAVAEIAANRSMYRDADRSWFQRLYIISGRMVEAAEELVLRILRLESQRHTARFIQAARRALGVDLTAVVRQEDLEDLLRDAALKNAHLIKGLADDTVKRVSQVVMNAVLNGQSAKNLRSDITRQFGISDRRATLIARNEIASFNADMNRLRHLQAGVTTYRWATSADERVRPLHRALDGKVYEYGKPTDAENGLPPGKPINCRCVAIGLVTF